MRHNSLLVISISLMIFCSTSLAEMIEGGNKKSDNSGSSSYSVMDFTYLRDTVFTLKPYFIEVNLKTQTAYLHTKNAPDFKFGISSGTKYLQDGINTKEGLFVIQAMLPKWHSRQFDSTLLLNWMGFNYGIGFHALVTSGYYQNLGKRKSSHGCLRITREVAKMLYSKVEIGTPVLVHSGNNAVVVSFADSSDNLIHENFADLPSELKHRNQLIYEGKYFMHNRPKLLIDAGNVDHPGLPIGNVKKIPKRQLLKPLYRYIETATPRLKQCMLISKR